MIRSGHQLSDTTIHNIRNGDTDATSDTTAQALHDGLLNWVQTYYDGRPAQKMIEEIESIFNSAHKETTK